VEHIHRHDAYASSTCWKERSSSSQSGKEVTLTPGQTFYEGPDDVHTVGATERRTQASKVRRGLGEEEGCRRGAARRVIRAFLEPNPLAMAKKDDLAEHASELCRGFTMDMNETELTTPFGTEFLSSGRRGGREPTVKLP